MRLLLDESLPRKLKARLAPHEVRTVPEMGWASKSNGELLRLAEQEFEIFLTPIRKYLTSKICRRFGSRSWLSPRSVTACATSNRSYRELSKS